MVPYFRYIFSLYKSGRAKDPPTPAPFTPPARSLQINSWLVRLYDFYSRVVKDNKTNKRA